jgi:hypothetical protein
MREGREKEREAVRERESSPIVWWSVACAGDGIWSERVTAERKKKRSHFERESTRPLFFFPAFFCLCSPIKFHAYWTNIHKSFGYWNMYQSVFGQLFKHDIIDDMV